MDGGRAKKFAVETIERNSEPIALLCDNIFYFAELGMQEFETSGLMMQISRKPDLPSSAIHPECRRGS
jgi:hypothetical protein